MTRTAPSRPMDRDEQRRVSSVARGLLAGWEARADAPLVGTRKRKFQQQQLALAHGLCAHVHYLAGPALDLLDKGQVLASLPLEEAKATVCSWDEEPGEYRWLFAITGAEVHLRILALPDQFPPRPDSEGALVFETRQPFFAEAAAVASGAASVLATYGEAEYMRLWVDHPFPTDLLRLVEARVASG